MTLSYKKTLLMNPPSWSGSIPALLEMLSDQNKNGKDNIKKEIIRMAALADRWVEHCKNEEEQNLLARVTRAARKSDDRPISQIITSERKTMERVAEIKEAKS